MGIVNRLRSDTTRAGSVSGCVLKASLRDVLPRGPVSLFRIRDWWNRFHSAMLQRFANYGALASAAAPGRPLCEYLRVTTGTNGLALTVLVPVCRGSRVGGESPTVIAPRGYAVRIADLSSAILIGHERFDPGASTRSSYGSWINASLACAPEEALFRGFLQQDSDIYATPAIGG